MNWFELSSISWIFDFLIISLILWRISLLVRGTRAISIFLGILIFAITYGVAKQLQLTMTATLLSFFFDHLIILVIILFQDEIRQTLADFGRKASLLSKTQQFYTISDSLATVATQMAKEHIGGLIVLEKEDKLKSIISTGSQINSEIKSELIYSIFLPQSPIHDGAVIISNGKIAAAGCFLPLSKDTNINKRYGTRHRAAIGLTQNSDAIVILISEESGQVHLVSNGKVNTNLNFQELKEALSIFQQEQNKPETIFSHIKKFFNANK